VATQGVEAWAEADWTAALTAAVMEVATLEGVAMGMVKAAEA
jgi:hypothetical protein